MPAHIMDDGNSTEETTTTRPKVPATYRVTFSTKIRPGTPLPVMVQLFNSGTVTSVEVSLRNGTNETIVFARAPVTSVSGGGDGQIINLEIPRTLKQPDWRSGWFQYTIHITGYGDINFNQSQVVNFDDKWFSIFVQTDKAMYKPGQTVKIRALVMQPSLLILNEPMDVYIRDPAGNGMKQWRQIQSVNNTGVVELSLPTSPYCPLGDWNIEVNMLGTTELKVFTIAKYVLPKFEVKVEVPKINHVSEPTVLGTVSAKYTFGKPLTEANVLITVKMSYYYQHGNKTQPTTTITGELNSKGEMPFAIDQLKLKEIYYNTYYQHSKSNPADLSIEYQQFTVIVNVTDVRTGDKMGDDDSFTFTSQKAKIEFLPISANTYKPGLTYTAHVSVRKNDNSLFEDYQNINVTFNVTIEVLSPTTTTTTTTVTTATSTTVAPDMNATTDGEKRVELQPKDFVGKRRPGHWYPSYQPTNTVVLLTVNKTLTANGFLQIDVDVPSYARDVTVTAMAFGTSQMKYATKFESASANFMQIESSVDTPKVGKIAEFSVITTEPVNSIIYQIYAKGILLSESKIRAADEIGNRFNLRFEVTNNMAPNCRILAFYFRQDGEIVADSMSFKVTLSSDSQVGVTFSKNKVKPGEEVDLKLMARPNSTVFLLSVDKSVQLLKSDNDITQDLVDKQLMEYDFGQGGFGFWRYMVACGWPFRSQGSDAFTVFRDANVAIFTDGVLYRKQEEPYYYDYLEGGRAMPMMAFGAGASASGQDPVERVRTFFPETWLWDMVMIGSNGQMVMPQTAPDTITTWLTSAFAVHPQFGLSVVNAPAELTTFRDVFVSLDMPYSAVRGEDLCLKAFVFNYYEEPLYMRLMMARNEGISNIRLLRKSWTSQERVEHRMPMDVSHRVGKVYPDKVGESLFCFTPNVLGQVTIQVNLTATTIQGAVFPGDGVEHMLLIEPEGTPRAHTQSVILDLKNSQPFMKTVPIKFPAEAIHGSKRITVSLAGDLMGSVFDNIDDLLRMPYGCGEQNMLYFAPNVFLIDYLQKTNSYSKELAQKAEDYMLKGYQKELTYQHKDGSYSAFGEHNNATGSMWLTAFVTKCFAQSMFLKGDVISVDPKIVGKSLKWIIAHQEKNGSFSEPGTVFNKNMQGGSGTGEALTAYVLIALAEAQNSNKTMEMDINAELQAAITHAKNYLENQLQALQDPYDLAIVTYALHLSQSIKMDAAYELLLQRAKSESLMLHWERPKSEEDKQQFFYWQRQTDAINIEATAYGLLTLMRRANMEKAVLVIRWMTLQRGPQGGFISTQDTVVGLQAFGQVATVLYQPTFTPVSVRVRWSAGGQQANQSLILDNSNKQLLQKVDIPLTDMIIPADVTIYAQLVNASNFTGMAVAEVTLDYNVLEPTSKSVPAAGAVFSLVPKVTVQDEENFQLRIVASRIDGKTSGMTTINVGIPTGYSVVESHDLWNTGGASMAEVKDGQYVLYFDEMGSMAVEVTLPMKLTSGVTINTQPVPIQIVDYYESGSKAQMTVNYELPKVDFICDRQPTYESCPYVPGIKVSGLNGA